MQSGTSFSIFISTRVTKYCSGTQKSFRLGQTQKFQMKFRPAKNYPLDLYYLMDLTWSMQEHKEMLFRVGNDLALTLEKLTENYLIGFGSFVDKPSMPFAPMGKEMNNPCALAGDHSHSCEKTYGFRHHQLLTSNVKEFKEKVNASAVSANYDNLEGTLDALMQTIVCEERVGFLIIEKLRDSHNDFNIRRLVGVNNLEKLLYLPPTG